MDRCGGRRWEDYTAISKRLSVGSPRYPQITIHNRIFKFASRENNDLDFGEFQHFRISREA